MSSWGEQREELVFLHEHEVTLNIVDIFNLN